MTLYPAIAAIFVVIAQYAWTRSLICREPDQEAELWKKYRNFLYAMAVALVLAAFAGHYLMDYSAVSDPAAMYPTAP